MSTSKVYFISDLHLGSPLFDDERAREARLVKWLDSIKGQCSALYLMGDVFDFWFEYKYVVPKGYVRFLAKICEFTDAGIPVHFFTGNHDMWAFDYLEKECGMRIHRDLTEAVEIGGKRFLLGHGDGLNPNEKQYLFLRRMFHCRFLQVLFSWIHPGIGFGIARKWSSHSRLTGRISITQEEESSDIIYCRERLLKEHFDFFVFGHRHYPVNIELLNGSRYINIGDWVSHYTYGVFEDGVFYLRSLSR